MQKSGQNKKTESATEETPIRVQVRTESQEDKPPEDKTAAENERPEEELEQPPISADGEEQGTDAAVAEANEEIARLKDMHLRALAEFENYKKRSAREAEEFRKYANESIVRDLLPIVDNLERAIQSSDQNKGDSACLIQGVDLTLREILKVLEKYGVTPVEADGRPFDPAFHEAVMREETDEHPENTVIRELQRGYVMNTRVIRPSMVVVSAPGANASEPAAE